MVQTTSNERTMAGSDSEIRPLGVHIPEEALVELRQRITATRWPDRVPGPVHRQIDHGARPQAARCRVGSVDECTKEQKT